MLKCTTMSIENLETKKVTGVRIWDGKQYTSIETVQRYPKDAKVLKMTTENGFSCVMKHSHPSWCMITRNDVGESVVPFSELMNKWVLTEKGYSKVVSLEEVEYEGFLYDVSTVTKAYEADGIRTHNSFHSGGIATGRGVQSVSALQRAQQLFNMPKTLPNSAVLAKHSGTVSRIEKDPSTNGHYIFVKAEKDEHKHYVPPSRELLIKSGDDISRGDSLSDGVINPRQLLQYKNMDAVRDYLTDQLHSIYKNVGGTRRRNVEVVVKNLTNLTEVHDPGKSEHLTGDILPLNKVQEFNALAKPEDKIIHAPILRGIKETALLKDEDYLSRMNFQRIQSTIVEGAGKGWKTTTKNTTNPIPAFAASTITPQLDKNKPHY